MAQLICYLNGLWKLKYSAPEMEVCLSKIIDIGMEKNVLFIYDYFSSISYSADYIPKGKGKRTFSKNGSLCSAQTAKFATISGIGACDLVSLNFYDIKTKKYYEKVLEEDVELIILMGNFTLKDGKPFAHIHGTFGDDKYQTWSGHVSKAIVSVTAEIVVTFTDMQVSRELNEDVGIYLIP